MPHVPPMIGGYRILRLLGEGGMGVVYLAESVRGERVAVKVIRGEHGGGPERRRRFRREVELLRRVAEAAPLCIVAILDSGVDGDLDYLVTEYVEGPDLAERVRVSGPLDESELIGLGVGMAAALQAMHETGVVHRDLKPGNVLLGPAGPKVIDFGIAQRFDGSATLTQDGPRTPGYMSPEQARGEQVTPASDVFSWGAVMAFAATGRCPFGEGTLHAVSRRVIYGEPDLEGVDDRLGKLLTWALHKDVKRRPGVGQLHAALVAGPGEDPVPVPEVSWTIPDPFGPVRDVPVRPRPTWRSKVFQRVAGLALAVLGIAGVLTVTGPLKSLSAVAAACGLVLLVAPFPWAGRRAGAAVTVLALLLPLNVLTGVVPMGRRVCEEPGVTQSRRLAVEEFDPERRASIRQNGSGLWTIITNSDYRWAGLRGALPDWCRFQVDLDVTAKRPVRALTNGVGWGYGLGLCSRFDGYQPRGLSLQYSFYQAGDDELTELSMTRLPAANAFPGKQPPQPRNGLDNATHHWRIKYNLGKVSYELDQAATETGWYPVTGYPLLADCFDSEFLLRAWHAEIEVDNIVVSPG